MWRKCVLPVVSRWDRTDNSEVDCACGIPDSGVGMALGYAEGKGVPYHRAISKYTPTWPRSFTPSKQEIAFVGGKDETDSEPCHAGR